MYISDGVHIRGVYSYASDSFAGYIFWADVQSALIDDVVAG